MNETPADLDWLDRVLERSIESAGQFLRESFQMPDHSLSARRLAAHLAGLPTVALATVTEAGEPRVAPISTLFYRARFHIPTVRNAARTRHLSRRPAASLTYYDGTDLAVIVHGTSHAVWPGDDTFAELETIHRELNGSTVTDWGDGVFLRIDPDRVFTFSREPGDSPASP